MPRHFDLPEDHPGNRPFPKSYGWNGESWATIAMHHMRAQAEGSRQHYVGFDDTDALCLVARDEAEKILFAVRVPRGIAPWLEEALREADVKPGPVREDQARVARGPGGSLYRDDPLPGLDELHENIADRLGTVPDHVGEIGIGEDMLNLHVDGGSPVRVLPIRGDVPGALGYLRRETSGATIVIATVGADGVIETREDFRSYRSTVRTACAALHDEMDHRADVQLEILRSGDPVAPAA